MAMIKGRIEVKKGIEIDLGELAAFLVKAKRATYASESAVREEVPQRPGFKELSFKDGNWEYRDSYSGSRYAPGQEYVKFDGLPVWAMAYSGGMLPEYHKDLVLIGQTFGFLKKVLLKVDARRPFRGPKLLVEGDWMYQSSVKGNMIRLVGLEQILYKGKEVFSQDFIGQVIIHELE